MVDRKSFIVYCNSLECIDFMTNTQKGELFTALLKYASGEDITEFSCGAVRASFNFMSSQISRDLDKYEERCEQNRENGRKGGRPKKEIAENNKELDEACEGLVQVKEDVVNGCEEDCSQNNRKETEKPKKPYNDNNNDNDNDNENYNTISSSTTYTVKPADIPSAFKEIRLPLDDGEFVIDEKRYKYYSSMYPSLNLYLCFQDMRCWLEVNKDKRRSASVMDRFICGWLSRNLSAKVSQAGSSSKSQLYDRDALLKQLDEWEKSHD